MLKSLPDRSKFGVLYFGIFLNWILKIIFETQGTIKSKKVLLQTNTIKFHTTLDLVSDVKSLLEVSMTYERIWSAYLTAAFSKKLFDGI